MLRTYEGILKGDHLEWTGDRPSSNRPLRIHIALLDEEGGPERGECMAAALGRLAERGGPGIEDPVKWQR